MASVGVDGRSISILDGSLTPITTLRPAALSNGARIQALEFSSGGEVVFVADSGQPGGVSSIRRFDGKALDRWDLPPGQVPRSLALPRNGTVLLVSHGSASGARGLGGITILSASNLHELGRLEVCGGRAGEIAVMRTGERAFVRCFGDTVAVVDLELRRIARTVAVGRLAPDQSAVRHSSCGPGSIALSRTEGLLLLPCSRSGYLVLVDRLTMEPFDSMVVPLGTYHIAASPSRPEALTAPRDRAQVSIINLSTRVVEANVSLAGEPSSIVMSGRGDYAYVATQIDAGGRLVLLDMGLRAAVAVDSTGAGRALSLWPGRWSPVLAWR